MECVIVFTCTPFRYLCQRQNDKRISFTLSEAVVLSSSKEKLEVGIKEERREEGSAVQRHGDIWETVLN